MKAAWQSELNRLDAKSIDEDYTSEVQDPNSESWKKFRDDVGCELTQTMALGMVNRIIAPDS